jgi:hypothetical protein
MAVSLIAKTMSFPRDPSGMLTLNAISMVSTFALMDPGGCMVSGVSAKTGSNSSALSGGCVCMLTDG